MKYKYFLFTIIVGIVAVSLPLFALDVPVLKGHVNDYAGMFKPGTVGILENELAEFEKKEPTQIVVLTVPSLQGEVLEEFSMKVAEKWRIGQKKLDNGVILLIAKQDRKVRIEVGYGLEGRLTDLTSGRIIDNDIKPLFKTGDFDTGVINGVHSIIRAVKGEYNASAPVPAQEEKQIVPWYTPFLIIGGIVLFVGLLILLAWKRGVAGGGGSGSYSGESYSSGSSDGGSSSSDSYSGGGGSFGGGGASGDW